MGIGARLSQPARQPASLLVAASYYYLVVVLSIGHDNCSALACSVSTCIRPGSQCSSSAAAHAAEICAAKSHFSL